MRKKKKISVLVERKLCVWFIEVNIKMYTDTTHLWRFTCVNACSHVCLHMHINVRAHTHTKSHTQFKPYKDWEIETYKIEDWIKDHGKHPVHRPSDCTLSLSQKAPSDCMSSHCVQFLIQSSIWEDWLKSSKLASAVVSPKSEKVQFLIQSSISEDWLKIHKSASAVVSPKSGKFR